MMRNKIGNKPNLNSTQVSLLCITWADTDSSVNGQKHSVDDTDIPEVYSPYDFNLMDAKLDQFKGFKAFLEEHQEERIAEEIAQALDGIAGQSARELGEQVTEKLLSLAQTLETFAANAFRTPFRSNSISDLCKYYQPNLELQKVLRVMYQPLDDILAILPGSPEPLKRLIKYHMNGIEDTYSRSEKLFRIFIEVGVDPNRFAYNAEKTPQLFVVNEAFLYVCSGD